MYLREQLHLRRFHVIKTQFMLLLATIIVLATWGVGLASEKPEPPASRTVYQHLPLLEVFSSQYKILEQRAEHGGLPPQARERAAHLWTSLQHYLIDSHALIQKLRIEIKQKQGAAQERAIDALLEAGAERERTLMAYIQHLEGLQGDAEEKSLPLKQPSNSQQRSIRRFDSVSGEEPGDFKIEIEIGAEDLTETEME